MLIPTVDPSVFIEDQRDGYVRYLRDTDGRRWEVHGVCDRRGDCVIGSVLTDGTVIEDKGQLEQLVADGRFPESDFDTPVTPEFTGCCPFTYVELEAA